ncbi:MAG: hypothetical protein DHS20C12_24610 [Pseudohongiella sp.]|nr:MAG: hypothetical protein DHS20C12_24610 [Pseudohongiella sp.]
MHSLNNAQTGNEKTGLYDLWLNSMLPTVGPSMVTGVTSSSSHQIDSERLAEKLMQLCVSGTAGRTAEERF